MGQKSALLNIKQGTNETLREFITRFSSAIRSNSKTSDDVAILALQAELKASNFTTSLTREPTHLLK